MKTADFEAALSDPLALHAFVQAGLPVNLVVACADALGINVEKLAQMCGLSRATFHRKKSTRAKLGPLESDLLARYASLHKHATDVFRDAGAAGQWLQTPQVGLGGKVPLELARTTHGFQEVEKLLTRIEYSVYA